MPAYPVTANTDLTTPGKGKRLRSWHFSNSGAAAVINLRDGSVTGTIQAQIQLAANTSSSQAYPIGSDMVFAAGLFVQIVSGTIVGSVDI